MTMLSGPELESLLNVARSDARAAERLIELYRPALHMAAAQHIGPGLRRRESASDIVQQTLLEAHAAIRQFRGETVPEFAAWLRQILRRNTSNLARNHQTAKRDVRRERYPDTDAGSIQVTWLQPVGRATSPSQCIIKAEAALYLTRAIDALPIDQRAAIKLRHLDGLSIDEIATAMQKSHAAIAGLVRRGLKTLREQLADSASQL
jgi:RNA polymerase sigma-70 factor, ECF subfamily